MPSRLPRASRAPSADLDQIPRWAAAFFAAGARKRAAAEAGLDIVSHREADDLVRDADTFLVRVCEVLEVPHQSSMGSALLHVG